MRHRTLRGGLVLCLSIATVAAVAWSPDRATAAGGGEVQITLQPAQQAPDGVHKDAVDVAFFSGKRPLLLRLHVTVNGKTVLEYRNAYVKKWFDYLDRDGDGFLSEKEAALVPTTQMLQQLRQNGFGLGIGPGGLPKMGPVNFALLDTNEDGKVSFAELVAHFERAGYYPIQLAGGQVTQTLSNRASEVLFDHLELTKAALGTKEKSFALADALMRKFDADDDETISMQELVRQFGAAGVPQPPRPKGAIPFHLISSRDDEETVALKLIAAYAKPGAVKLQPGDCDFGPGVFEKLDTNKDGSLDLFELQKWQQRTPDLEFVVRIGKTGRDELQTDLLQPGGKKPAMAGAVTRTADGVTSLTAGDAQLSLARSNDDDGRFAVLFRGGVLQLFRAKLNPDRGFVELKDFDGPQFQIMRQLFPLLDRNGDGKLTEEEVQEYVRVEQGAGTCAVTISVLDHGRGLFQLLDVNRDGRLTLRELRSAWERLAPLDKNGAGVISQDAILRQFQITVALASSGGRFAIAVPAGQRGAPPPLSTRGPVWFRKMDRNGTGDVSFRNFLGTREQFDRIDTDGDGLISVEEAERHDALMRKQK
jgi:Ca2+-binding EF-hand superfamily protein